MNLTTKYIATFFRDRPPFQEHYQVPVGYSMVSEEELIVMIQEAQDECANNTRTSLRQILERLQQRDSQRIENWMSRYPFEEARDVLSGNYVTDDDIPF